MSVDFLLKSFLISSGTGSWLNEVDIWNICFNDFTRMKNLFYCLQPLFCVLPYLNVALFIGDSFSATFFLLYYKFCCCIHIKFWRFKIANLIYLTRKKNNKNNEWNVKVGECWRRQGAGRYFWQLQPCHANQCRTCW